MRTTGSIVVHSQSSSPLNVASGDESDNDRAGVAGSYRLILTSGRAGIAFAEPVAIAAIDDHRPEGNRIAGDPKGDGAVVGAADGTEVQLGPSGV